MPAVNPVLAILSPSGAAAKASRPSYVLQDMMAARATQDVGSRAYRQDSASSDENVEKSFSSLLEAGMEKGQDRKEASRSAQDEASRRAAKNRKEDAAAAEESGNDLPLAGTDLPPEKPVAEASLAGNLFAQNSIAEADAAPSAATLPPASPDTLASALSAEASDLPASAATLPLQAPDQEVVSTAPVSPFMPTPLAVSAIAEEGLPAAAPQPLTAETEVKASVPVALAASDEIVQTDLQQPLNTATESDAGNPASVVLNETPASLALSGAAQPATPKTDSVEVSSNPFAAMPADTDATLPSDSAQGAAQQQKAVAQEQSAELAAAALAQGTDSTSLIEATTGQSDLAERVRAWRGLSPQDGAALQSLFARSEAAGSSLVAQSGGQLQQFADSLRLAVGQADASSLFNAGDRASAAQTFSQTLSQTGTPATSTSTLTSGAAANAAVSADTGSAWRADNLQLPAPTGTPRAAAGTLQFMQTMQASNFGAPLGETFGQNAWAESVTQRVALMTGQKLSSARIELDPPELGAMTVKVSVSGDQASVSFSTPHAIVRDALEQTLPRLQEMLGQQGLQLADAQVSDQSAERQNSGNASRGTNAGAGESGEDGTQSTSLQSVKVATSLIDYYA